jgi:SET domain-containing protein 6
LKDDEQLLSQGSSLSVNGRNAIIVRLGEKRILRATREASRRQFAGLDDTAEVEGGGKKREKAMSRKEKREEKKRNRDIESSKETIKKRR